MTSDGWEPDALTAHVRICEGANSIAQGSNIVTPPRKPVANRENKLYPKCERVRSTHPSLGKLCRIRFSGTRLALIASFSPWRLRNSI